MGSVRRDLRLWIDRSLNQDTMKLQVVLRETIDGTRRLMGPIGFNKIGGIVFEPIEAGDMVAPLLYIDEYIGEDSTLHQLAQQLWDLGYRPKSAMLHESKDVAVQEHIKDLRAHYADVLTIAKRVMED